MIIRIFIGSSTEGLDVARYIKEVLEKDPLNKDARNNDFECIVWDDGTVFEPGISYLDSLTKAASMFDFGILVVTKDNKAEVRKQVFDTPNDNVIFEFGLFIGRLGTNRAFVLQERDAKLPSDMNGINVANFAKTDNVKESESLNREIENFRSLILKKIKLRELGLLPSTGLAMGYFENFINPTCLYLYNAEFNNEKVEIENTVYRKFEVQIYIPNDLTDNMRLKSDYYFNKNGFKACTLKASNGREIKTVYKIDATDHEKLIFCDMPTTLSALFNTIVLYLKKGAVGKSQDQNLIEDRELNNFKLTLQVKLDENDYHKEIVKIIEQ